MLDDREILTGLTIDELYKIARYHVSEGYILEDWYPQQLTTANYRKFTNKRPKERNNHDSFAYSLDFLVKLSLNSK